MFERVGDQPGLCAGQGLRLRAHAGKFTGRTATIDAIYYLLA
jgi:hypothetical protein